MVSEMPYRKARPLYVDLRPNRTAKALQPLFIESQRDALSSNDPNKAVDYTAAVLETRGIQSYSGAIAESEAQQQAFFDTYPLVVNQKLMGKLGEFWEAVFESFQEHIKSNENLWIEVKNLYNAVRSMKLDE